MKYLNINELSSKENTSINQLRHIGFEYLLAGMAKEYATVNKLYDSTAFNECNELTFSKALVYPFFVAVSNGHTKALYNLFGEFRAFSFGPSSVPLAQLVVPNMRDQENQLKYFEFKNNFVGLQLMNNLSFDQIRSSIEKQQITFPEANYKFSEIFIPSDAGAFHPISMAIDTGIQAIRVQSADTFFKSDSKGLVMQAAYFHSFQEAYNQNLGGIMKDQIEAPDRRPFYQEELSHY